MLLARGCGLNQKELIRAINAAVEHPLGLELQIRGIRKDIEKSKAPQTLPDALRAFIEAGEA